MSQQQNSGQPRGHTRNKSSTTKEARPRSSTKGPLDAADTPLNDPLSSTPDRSELDTSKRLSGQGSPAIRSPSVRSPGNPMSTPGGVRTSIAKDFSFLLRPEIYHPLTPLNVPAAFRNSSNHSGPGASLEELLSKGHFRAAAIAAVQELTSTTPPSSSNANDNSPNSAVDSSDQNRIFSLLYTRLACLTLIEATNLAAQEVKALGDLNNSSIYVDETTGEHLVPWELRVLNVRLQAIGFGDPRRAVMSYHDLAREARGRIGRAIAQGDDSATELWKARLHELGVRVAGALVEMDDLSGAALHLGTLRGRGGSDKMGVSQALLWLQLGDVEAAKRCVRADGSEEAEEGAYAEKVVLALCDMADGDYKGALSKWEGLREEKVDDEMVGVNMAVCQLYTGNMDQSRDVLEKLVDSGYSSHTLLFNLSTVYELCTEKNRVLKQRLAERVAGHEPTRRGWEKNNADFKL